MSPPFIRLSGESILRLPTLCDNCLHFGFSPAPNHFSSSAWLASWVLLIGWIQTKTVYNIGLVYHVLSHAFRHLFWGGREGQAAMNPVEKSPKPCRKSLRTLWKISEPCKEQKMCYSGGNCIISPFFSTYGTGSHKSITNKCNFDLFHGLSICLFCIPILG